MEGIWASGPGGKSFWKNKYTNSTRVNTGQSDKIKIKSLGLREILFSPITSASILSRLSRWFSFFLALRFDYQKVGCRGPAKRDEAYCASCWQNQALKLSKPEQNINVSLFVFPDSCPNPEIPGERIPISGHKLAFSRHYLIISS